MAFIFVAGKIQILERVEIIFIWPVTSQMFEGWVFEEWVLDVQTLMNDERYGEFDVNKELHSPFTYYKSLYVGNSHFEHSLSNCDVTGQKEVLDDWSQLAQEIEFCKQRKYVPLVAIISRNICPFSFR